MSLTHPRGVPDINGTLLCFLISFTFLNAVKKVLLIQQTFLRHLLIWISNLNKYLGFYKNISDYNLII